MLQRIATLYYTLRISNLNRLSTKFRKYPSKEFLDKKSGVTACRY
ncbi:MAG: hypothetical protein ACJA0W_003641, partial [Candidatus Azotimanducaceae bacterium]